MIAESSSLNIGDLNDLLEGKILAIRIPEYCPPAIADRLVEAIAQSARTNRVRNKCEVESLLWYGSSLLEVGRNPTSIASYLDQVAEDFAGLRNILCTLKSPIEIFWEEIGRLWPAGSTILKVHGRDCYFGLWRIFLDGGEALPHQDDICLPEFSATGVQDLRWQLSVNIYMKVPTEGGELELWHDSIPPAGYSKLRGDTYGVSRDTCGSAAIVIKPERGDLIIINAKKLHAVKRWNKGVRATNGCFIGISELNEPLAFWS